MHFEIYEENSKRYFPVVASVIGVIFNSISLLISADKFIDLGISKIQLLAFILVFSIVIGGIFCFIMYWFVSKKSERKTPDEFEVIEQEDEIMIEDDLGKVVEQSRFLVISPKRNIKGIKITTLPTTSGKINSISCKQIDKDRNLITDLEYLTSGLRKKNLHIVSDLNKGYTYYFLCTWQIQDGFSELEEGIGLKPLPKQKKSLIRVIFPQTLELEYVKCIATNELNSRNLIEKTIKPEKINSKIMAQFDFSNFIKAEYDMSFSILWKRKA